MKTTIATAVAAALALGSSAPAVAGTARTFDLVTYTAPDGFTVETAADHVLIKRVGTKSYCVIGIYGAAAASADLDASFASEWSDLVNRSLDPVAAPAAQHATLAGVDSASGMTMTTTGGKPVLAMMTTFDAGAKVVSIVVLTPGADDLKVYMPSITALYGSLAIQRVAPAAPAPDAPAAPAPAPAPSSDDGLPPPPTKPITLADLAGAWSDDAGAVQSYVHADGGYAGYSSIQNSTQWTVDAKKALVAQVFTSASSNTSGAHGFTQKRKLHIKITGGDLELTSADGQYTGEDTHYLIIGWRVTPDATFMLVKGPYENSIPDDVQKDPSRNSYMNETFVRAAKSK